MNKVHMILQGKGGVGKSLVASMLAQYYIEKDRQSINIDTDPVNSTFKNYKSLNVMHIKLIDENQKLDARNFDDLVETILAEDTDFIIDNGASTFLPLANCMLDNKVPELITGSGKELVVHCIISGGQALLDTLSGLSSLIQQMPKQAKIIIWKNEFFGEIIADGKRFEEMAIYKQNAERISDIVTIAKMTADTFAKDFAMMLDRKLTFQEAIASSEFGLMAKQRLAMIRKSIFDQIVAII